MHELRPDQLAQMATKLLQLLPTEGVGAPDRAEGLEPLRTRLNSERWTHDGGRTRAAPVPQRALEVESARQAPEGWAEDVTLRPGDTLPDVNAHAYGFPHGKAPPVSPKFSPEQVRGADTRVQAAHLLELAKTGQSEEKRLTDLGISPELQPGAALSPELVAAIVQKGKHDGPSRLGAPTSKSRSPLARQADSLVKEQLVTEDQPVYSDLAGFVRSVQARYPADARQHELPLDPFAVLLRASLPRAAGSSNAPGGRAPGDVSLHRGDFPILKERVNGRPLVWFDNAATTQKPQKVIDALSHFYGHSNSNIHRGAHALAARATDAYEHAREVVRHTLNARLKDEIVFVRGTTEGINLISNSYGKRFLKPGDEIVLSELEHHANIVPWQLVARECGAVLKVIPVNDRGEVLLDAYVRLLSPRTRLVALAHANNSLGTVLPIQEMIALARKRGAHVLVDGAQSIAHLPVDVQALDVDFFVFSGHKIFGPTGIGAVFGRQELWEALPPWQGGGNMIQDVTFEHTRFAAPPARFEAGTPSIADAHALGVALEYVQEIGLANIGAHEQQLLTYATEELQRIPGLRLVGTAREKVAITSFILTGKTVAEVGKYLDEQGIAVRAGHHCAQPSLRRMGLEATVRPSYSFYNTRDEIDLLVDALRCLQRR